LLLHTSYQFLDKDLPLWYCLHC